MGGEIATAHDSVAAPREFVAVNTLLRKKFARRSVNLRNDHGLIDRRFDHDLSPNPFNPD